MAIKVSGLLTVCCDVCEAIFDVDASLASADVRVSASESPEETEEVDFKLVQKCECGSEYEWHMEVWYQFGAEVFRNHEECDCTVAEGHNFKVTIIQESVG